MLRFLQLIALTLGTISAFAASNPATSSPTVHLDNSTFTGTNYGSITSWLGIPYAQSPTGNNRFRLPVPIQAYNGSQTATSFGPACPQQHQNFPTSMWNGTIPDSLSSFLVSSTGPVVADSEDCLTINVIAPANATVSSKLPVVVYLYGGAFQLGSPQVYNGSAIVASSLALGEPIIYVSFNFRASAFGFLASKEVKEAGVGNIGLQDQRTALRWVQKYIGAFGGDKSKVTIWGTSSGSISVAMQMLTNGGNTEGLFRAAVMESGSPIPVGDISHGQSYYDLIVTQTGCSSSSDTLECLRGVPYETLLAAVNNCPGAFSYQSLILAWLPLVDGVFLTDDPQVLVQKGQVARIPFMSGDCDDEGTLSGTAVVNVTTTAELKGYVTSFIATKITPVQLEMLITAYPQNPTLGSPFNTGTNNSLTRQSKRIAALLGDYVFHAPRRFFLRSQSGKQPMWSWLSKREKSTAFLGAFHGTDLGNFFGGGELADYLVHFVTSLDPNGPEHLTWPAYTKARPSLMTFLDGAAPLAVTQDTFRQSSLALLTQIQLQDPI